MWGSSRERAWEWGAARWQVVWASSWEQSERLRTRRRGKQPPAPDSSDCWVLTPHLASRVALPGIQGVCFRVTSTPQAKVRNVAVLGK